MAIPLELLQQVRTIIVHQKSPTQMCPDGIASAMILHDALLNAEIRFIAYGTQEHTNLPATKGMLFCDFSPPAARVQEFVNAGAIVLDHHASARNIVAAFGELGVFGDEKTEPGVSGALLAYQHVWRPLFCGDAPQFQYPREQLVYDFAVLAGVRDTWQTKHPSWLQACQQAEALQFYPPEYLLKLVPANWGLPIGELLYEKKLAFAQDLSLRGVIRPVHTDVHHPVANLDVIMFGTTAIEDTAELILDRACIIAGFRYTVESGDPVLIVSLRAGSADLDLGRIAKHFGGGGHTKAAGFSVKLSEVESASPYDILPQLLRQAIQLG